MSGATRNAQRVHRHLFRAAEFALARPTFHERNAEQSRLMGVVGAKPVIASLGIVDTARQKEVITAYRALALAAGEAFAPAFSESGQKVETATEQYATAAKQARVAAHRYLPLIINAVLGGGPLSEARAAEIRRAATRTVKEASVEEVAAILAKDLKLRTVTLDGNAVMENLRVVAQGDRAFGFITNMKATPDRAGKAGPHEQSVEGISGLTRTELLTLALSAANTAWMGGQVHKAKWDGSTKRIDPEQSQYNSYDLLKARLFKTELKRLRGGASGTVAQARDKAFAATLTVVLKDLMNWPTE